MQQWLQFNADAEEIESLLLTEYHVFEHFETGKKSIACDEYVFKIFNSLPDIH